MKNEIVCLFENRTSGYNAGSKARTDIDEIVLNQQNYRIKCVDIFNTFIKYCGRKNQFLHFFEIKKANRELNKNVNLFKKSTIIILQYPPDPNTKAYQQFIEKMRGNKVVIVHDLNGLRFKDKNRENQDITFLKQCAMVISQNKKMSEYLKKKGINEKKLINLDVFDYLLSNTTKNNMVKDYDVCFAGNLAKSTFFQTNTKELAGLRISLFGAGYDGKQATNTIEYCGKFKAEEIHLHLNGRFGLVWDGSSIDTCDGDYGEYLRYNTPHKMSLYLAAGIPIIAWKDSAIAPFIGENGLGITVDSLRELPNLLETIEEEDYQSMLNQVDIWREKLIHGKIFENALRQAIQQVEEEL